MKIVLFCVWGEGNENVGKINETTINTSAGKCDNDRDGKGKLKN